MNLVDLTKDEMLDIVGGAEKYGCALLGGFVAAGFVTLNWWVVAGGMIAAYNAGCFSS